MSNPGPIGVFDSGVGGLTVLREIIDALPGESVIYLGDTARCPYGPRDLKEVEGFVLEIVGFLKKEGVKLVVIACNTGTAAGLVAAQKRFKELPIIGVIKPGAQAAFEATRNKKVGVIGTVGTIKSSSYHKALLELDAGLEVYAQPAPELVDFVERGEIEGAKVEKAIRKYLEPLKRAKIDTLILGCTHYPLLCPVIARVMGEEVGIISSAEETAQEVKKILERKNLLHNSPDPTFRFLSTGDPGEFLRLGQLFLGKEITEVEKVVLR